MNPMIELDGQQYCVQAEVLVRHAARGGETSQCWVSAGTAKHPTIRDILDADRTRLEAGLAVWCISTTTGLLQILPGDRIMVLRPQRTE